MLAYNSTIPIKLKPCKSCGVPSPIWSKGRCQQCAKVEGAYAREEKESKNDGLAPLREKLDELFSKYIRLKAADENGNCECYTCGAVKHWTFMQCGHFITRACMFLRWDERNVRVQDEECNCHKSGNMKVYREKLEKEKPGIVEILQEDAASVYKHSRFELNEMIRQYQTQVRILKGRL